MYRKVPSDLDFKKRELETLDFWKDQKIFEKSTQKNAGKEKFTFYDGPPTANGKPHIGHILTRAIKDLFPRYKTMRGFDVLRKAGWDTHGLPVELEVEKLLGLDGKEQIEEYGVEPFIEQCKESVWKYKGEWEKMSERVGYWADMENPYITYENDYIESVWWSLKEIFDKGLLYKGHKIVPYCPRCGTALSSHEVAQGYKDVSDDSIFVRFKVKGEDAYFLVWTTTPWTLPSNVALCVNPNVEYVLAQDKNGDQYYLAHDLCEKLLGEDAHIVRKMPGKELEYREYEPLYTFADPDKKAYYVTCADYVTTSDGSGIVHIAPAFGEDDAKVGRAYDLPMVMLVAPDGTMTGETDWEGKFVKQADPLITEDLEKRGLLFARLPYSHSYPFCWRCDTPLLYYARSSWFIEMTKLRDLLLENNDRINWMPDNIKAGRMGNFLENVIDWGISRERYWGTPLPIWVCKDCGKTHAIGSRAELEKMTKGGVPHDLELHKPYIDEVVLECPDCGGDMKRVPEVIDCWYDSGSMPFAQWHYPFENKEEFEKRFPADFISEAVDQTRGWFYTLLAISTLIFGKPSFDNCIVLGHVQDKDGQKMSKHKGNVVDPWSVLNDQGADAVRWYFYSASSPWLPSRFSKEAVAESQRKFMGTLWNTYAFYILYAEVDGFDPTGKTLNPENIMDKWVLSRLNSLILRVTDDLDHYRIFEAARAISDFADELSNWYVRRCRSRYWGSEMNKDKEDAYLTLYTVLKTLCSLLAPFLPFMTENIYQNLVRSVDKDAPESVHLTDWPQADERLIDAELEENMNSAQIIVNLGRACRSGANIKNRQPLEKIIVSGIDALPDAYADVIKGELNVKEVELNARADEYINYEVKPELRSLGPKYGKKLGAIRKHLSDADGAAIVERLKSDGSYTFDADGEEITLSEKDVLIRPKQKEGFAAETSEGTAVILDTRITHELLEEGRVRELISKIQTMRKDADFEVTDRIQCNIWGNDALIEIVKKNEDAIKKETLTEIFAFEPADNGKEWDVNGLKGIVAVKKV